MSRVVLGLGGLAVYGAGVVAAYKYFSPAKEDGGCACRSVESVTEGERMSAYSEIASTFDRQLGRDETMMGITLMRRLLVRHATGKVLEIGAGTARNLDYIVSYGKGVSEIALTDSTENMLPVMQEKIDALSLKGGSLTKDDIKACVCSAEDLSDFETDSYDTVIDTFGLCSYENPDVALKEMRRVCRAGGKLLLLEHGKGYYDMLNEQLDNSATDHALKWGCVWNKDIEAILLGAGFQQNSITRFHFGTTFYVVESNQ